MVEPSRKLKKSAVKNIVRFPSIKANGGKNILVESILESKYCLHLEFNPDIETYFPQPRRFRIISDLGEAEYTPDFEICYSSGIRYYIEIKPRKHINTKHYLRLFSDFDSMLKAQNSNTKFDVIDESFIYEQPKLSNYEKLYQFRKRPTLDMSNLYRCAGTIIGKVKLSDLIVMLDGQATLREIYTWLALGYLQFNINSEPLTMATEVEFHVE